MPQLRASKGLMLAPRTIPNESEKRRTQWLEEARKSFVTPSPANRTYYSVILAALWPPGHGIPGPILSESDLRTAIDGHRQSLGQLPYKDVFRRMRELQGEEGFVWIRKEGVRYQLQSLDIGQKRPPRETLGTHEWIVLKQRYQYRCASCGGKEPEVRLSPDHKIPRLRNGSNDVGNWQPLCEQCNNIKSNSCRGCQLMCQVCCWAFPEDYKMLVIGDDNKELIRRQADNQKLSQSDVVNMILRDHFRNKQP